MDAVVKSPENSSIPVKNVIVHPLALLSALDHFFRDAPYTPEPEERFGRVVGVLLGSSFKGTVEVSNSYGVPFKENEENPSLWFLNRDYIEKMFSLFKKVNAKEYTVGWYSAALQLGDNDMDIHRLFHEYVPNPVLILVDVLPMDDSLPMKAFCDVEESNKTATQIGHKAFVHVPSEIAADEAEEVGVEHLLRDVQRTTMDTLETEVSDKLTALAKLHTLLKDKIGWYLGMAVKESFPSNHEILWNLQIMNKELKIAKDAVMVAFDFRVP